MKVLKLLFALACPISIWAQSWSTPVLGYTYDAAAKSIRPITGVAGAAEVDGVLPAASKLEWAAISPDRKYALAETLTGDTVLALMLPGSGATALEGSLTGVSLAAISPGAARAVIYSAAQGKAQLWKNLPAAPQLEREIAAAGLRRIAVSDDGTIVAVSEAGVIVLANETTVIASGGDYADLAFARGSRDLAVAERSGNQALLFRALEAPEPVAGPQDGVAEPVAIAFAEDGQKLIVANAASLLTVDLGSRAVSQIACDCKPSRLERTRGNSVFQLSRPGEEEFVLFDGDSIEPRVLRIPGGAR